MTKLTSATQAIQWAYYQGHAQKFSRLEPCIALSTQDTRLQKLENHILAANIMSAVEHQPPHISEWLRYAYGGEKSFTREGMAELEGILMRGFLVSSDKKYHSAMFQKIEKLISLAMLEYSRTARGNTGYSISERCRLLNNSLFESVKLFFETEEYEEYYDKLQAIASEKYLGSKTQQAEALEKAVDQLKSIYLKKNRLHVDANNWQRDYKTIWEKLNSLLSELERQPLDDISQLIKDINSYQHRSINCILNSYTEKPV